MPTYAGAKLAAEDGAGKGYCDTLEITERGCTQSSHPDAQIRDMGIRARVCAWYAQEPQTCISRVNKCFVRSRERFGK